MTTEIKPSPIKKDILPDTLKNNGTLAEIRLFLGLFYRQEGNVSMFYELDAFGSRLHKIDRPYRKVYQEINASIMCLLNGKIVEDHVKSQRTTSHIHSICMLMLLEKLFKESKQKGEKYLIDRLNESGPILKANGKEWQISYPLLLVQAVRFSQWESDNQDYCIESFSAFRAREYLDIRFKKWFGSSQDDDIKKILNTFARLIRWHTLEGQYQRGTATFGIEKLSMDDKYLTQVEKKLLYIFAAVDDLTRKDSSFYEQEVAKFLNQQRYPEGPFRPDILKDLKEEKYIKERKIGRVYRSYEDFKVKKESDKATESIIYSYTLPAGKKIIEMSESSKKNWEALLKAYQEAIKQNLITNTVTHISVDRNQRTLGLLNKIIKLNKLPININEQFKCVPTNKLLPDLGNLFPLEKIFRIAYHPEYVVETLYGLKLEGVDVNSSPIDFLRESFKKEMGNDTNIKRIPLPKVKRITDLLSYYNLYDKDKKMGVFPLHIIFDHGKAQFDVWLPELGSTQANEVVDERTRLTVTGILVRYIHALVSNYGMTCQYNHVDLDFSASKNFQSGSYKWHSLLVDPGECNDCKENLGLQIFDQYLTQVGIEKLETSFSVEKYLNAIGRRNATLPYEYDVSQSYKQNLDGKYVLGIDIGGTGIKLRFYKITKNKAESSYVLSYQPTVQKTNGSNDSNGKSKRTNFYVTPAQEIGSILGCSMPTLPPEKAGKTGDAGKYEDAADFAQYIVNTLSKKLEGFNKKIHDECFKNLLSVGFCWPGPIKQNTPASTSGILSNFKGYSNRILENDYAKIVQLDIATAVKNAFEVKRQIITREGYKDSLRKDEYSLTVALQNDGDVEAAGLAFGMLNKFESTNTPVSDNGIFSKLFREQSVVVIKAGTGTAGAFLDKGEIKGLNEFGKLIVNLGADNTPNINKLKDQRWPVGDANKFFSMGAFSEIVKGVPKALVRELTGRDIGLLIQAEKKPSLMKKPDFISKFGALELVSLAAPHIEWSDIYDDKGAQKKNITIKYYQDERAYRINSHTGSGADKKIRSIIETHTWYNLVRERLIMPLSLSAIKAESLEYLLEKLGSNRIARLNFEGVVQEKEQILSSVKKIGERLGDIVALLYDIYRMKGVVIAGGVMSDKKIATSCMEGLEEALEPYLYDTFFGKDGFDVVKQLTDAAGQNETSTAEEMMNDKLIIYRTGQNSALLGAAILGFDHYIVTQKITELQEIAKDPPENVHDKIKFLTETEAITFLKNNSVQLRITVSDEGTISRIE